MIICGKPINIDYMDTIEPQTFMFDKLQLIIV